MNLVCFWNQVKTSWFGEIYPSVTMLLMSFFITYKYLLDLAFYCAFGNWDSSSFCNRFHVLLHICALINETRFFCFIRIHIPANVMLLMSFFLWSILVFSLQFSCSVGIHPAIIVVLMYFFFSGFKALGFHWDSSCYCHVQAESMVSSISPTWTQLWRLALCQDFYDWVQCNINKDC